MICLVLIIQERENAGLPVQAEATPSLLEEAVVQFEEMKP